MARLTIRRAHADDTAAIVAAHQHCWRETYGASLPEAAYAIFTGATPVRRWDELLAARDAADGSEIFVVCDPAGVMCGFASCGRTQSHKLLAAGYTGEFFSIYLLSQAQRAGVGRALMRGMAAHLAATGVGDAAVWVLRDNPRARRFYEALGGVDTGVAGVWPIAGLEMPDLAYGWRDLSVI